MILPDDIFYEILLFVPVKSLLRFKTVSRYWCDVISSQEFGEDHHLKRCSSGKQSHYVISYSRTARSITLYPEAGKSFKMDLPFPLKECSNGEFVIQSKCRGLICATFSSGFSRSVIIWNPVTRKSKELPDSIETFGLKSVGVAKCAPKFALGFDPVAKDYKVVKMTSSKDMHRPNRKISIFSLKSNFSKTVDDETPYLPIQRAVSTDGYIFWLSKGLQNTHAVLKFNLVCDKLTPIHIPPAAITKTSPHEKISLSLYECSGRIKLVRYQLEDEIHWNMTHIWLLSIANRTWKESCRYKGALNKSFRGWDGPLGFTSKAAVVIDRSADCVRGKEDGVERVGVGASMKDAPHYVLHRESLVSPCW